MTYDIYFNKTFSILSILSQLTQLEEFVKNFVDALYKGEFGVVISQARTKIKRMVKVGQNEILIKYKDPLNKTYGIMILFNYEVQSYEIKYRGKTKPTIS